MGPRAFSCLGLSLRGSGGACVDPQTRELTVEVSRWWTGLGQGPFPAQRLAPGFSGRGSSEAEREEDLSLWKHPLLIAKSLLVATRWSPPPRPLPPNRCVAGACPPGPIENSAEPISDNHNQTHTLHRPMAPRAKLAHGTFPAGHWSWDHTAMLLTSIKSFLRCQLSSKASGVSLPVPPLRCPFSV